MKKTSLVLSLNLGGALLLLWDPGSDPTSPDTDNMSISDYTERDPEKLGGKLIFKGSRIPVYILFDYLESGCTIEEFMKHYPSLSEEQVKGYLRALRENCRRRHP